MGRCLASPADLSRGGHRKKNSSDTASYPPDHPHNDKTAYIARQPIMNVNNTVPQELTASMQFANVAPGLPGIQMSLEDLLHTDERFQLRRNRTDLGGCKRDQNLKCGF